MDKGCFPMRPMEPSQVPRDPKRGFWVPSAMEAGAPTASDRLGWKVLAVLAMASLGIAALWWVLAERVFQGTARSLLAVDAFAVALAVLTAFVVARTWRGRGLAFVLVAGMALACLRMAFVISNALSPASE
jgi:GNAT superfamily N-acetyltransferase